MQCLISRPSTHTLQLRLETRTYTAREKACGHSRAAAAGLPDLTSRSTSADHTAEVLGGEQQAWAGVCCTDEAASTGLQRAQQCQNSHPGYTAKLGLIEAHMTRKSDAGDASACEGERAGGRGVAHDGDVAGGLQRVLKVKHLPRLAPSLEQSRAPRIDRNCECVQMCRSSEAAGWRQAQPVCGSLSYQLTMPCHPAVHHRPYAAHEFTKHAQHGRADRRTPW